MIAKQSVLQFREYVVVNAIYKFIDVPSEYYSDLVKMKGLIDSYVIDIDYAFHKKEDGAVFLFTKVSVNQIENSLPGHSIFAEGIGHIHAHTYQAVPDSEKAEKLTAPAVNYAINQLRGVISSLTSNSPIGRYLLPSIDLGYLFEEKARLKNLVAGLKPGKFDLKENKVKVIRKGHARKS